MGLFSSKDASKDKKISELQNIIDKLESRLLYLEAELEKALDNARESEYNYQEQMEKNKQVVEQNAMFKKKLDSFKIKQDRILSVISIIMENSAIEASQKEHIYQILDI